MSDAVVRREEARHTKPVPLPPRRASLVMVGVLTLLIGFTLYAAAEILAPIFLALFLSLLLSPLVGRLRSLGIPEGLGAALVVLSLLAAVGWAVYGLSGPARDWLDKAPQNLAQVEDKLRAMLRPVEKVQQATRQVEQMTTAGSGEGRKVTIRERTWGEWLVAGTASILIRTLVTVVLLYFFLASGDLFMRRLVKAMNTGREKRRVVEIVRAVRRDVSAYLATVSLINAGLGLATGLVLWAEGMPNPALWGVMAFCFNFVPYAGPLVTISVLSVVGLVSFEDLGRALAPPLSFLVLTNIEAYLVTPLALGGRLTLNPALVFLALVLWSWLWSIPGAIMAVPLLVTFKAFADHLDTWEGIGIFLGGRD